MATKSAAKSRTTNTAATKKSSAQNGKQKSNAAPAPADSETTSGLKELLVDMLKDIYWAEKALTKALPKMSKNATSEELVAALDEHLTVTQEQVSRLEQAFEAMGEKAQAKKCEAMDGLIREANEMMESNDPGVVRDAAIIAAGQKVEHYEIASYGTICSLARTLGETEVADLLAETLEEEKEAGQKLTEVAEQTITAGDEESDDDDEEESTDTDDDTEEDDTEDDDTDDEAATGNKKSKSGNSKSTAGAGKATSGKATGAKK